MGKIIRNQENDKSFRTIKTKSKKIKNLNKTKDNEYDTISWNLIVI